MSEDKELLEEAASIEIYQRRQTYEGWKQGRKPFTELIYTVPEDGISLAKSFEIARLAFNYKIAELNIGRQRLHPFTFFLEGAGVHGDPERDYGLFSAFEPGAKVLFYLRGASKLELTTINELKNLLQNKEKQD